LDGSSFDVKRDDDFASDSIAIVGASCRFPGAPDLAAFARLLASGTDAVSEIPDGRWNKARLLHPERGQPGKTYTFAAGVLGEIDRFDPAFFGISPREAAQIDPQQRLLLELAHEAIEDAGLDGARVAGSSAGVFVGGSAWDYLNINLSDPAAVDAYTMTGVTLCSLSNRISYAFDLHGPSFTVDTACSSSLVALHQACEALRGGRMPMALVGGVNLLLAPQSFVGFSAASMLSPRGRCHAFDARADGYVRAEGGGVVILKRLADALAAGDRVRAVIRGTGVNSDGRTTGFSLPNKAAQAALLREVYGRFDLAPQDLVYVEAHGTGTQAGDPIEAGALGEVLGRARDTRLPIGSVKTNIGHLEAASGIAGLLKAMLVLQTGTIPASLHCDTPNPLIPFADLNLSLVAEPAAIAPAYGPGLGPAMVGVNSFGFGGTNAHAVLETAPFQAGEAARDAAKLPPLLMSARSEGALRDLALWWRERLSQPSAADPAALAALIRGAARYREQHKLRLAIAGDDAAELRAGLAAFCGGRGAADVMTGASHGGSVAFVFSGNGAQWVGMATDAIGLSPGFRAGLAMADAALLPWLGWSVQERIGRVDDESLRDAAIAQPLLFAIQVAAVLALDGLGVRADACMGHSVGEVAAAWAAGALDLDQAARVIAARSRHQRAARDGHGGMAVIGLGADAAADALDGTGLEIAAFNSDAATTIAGRGTELAAFGEEAARLNWPFTRLDLDYAFHSSAMDPIRQPLLRDLAGLRPQPTRLRFVSTVTGGHLAGDELGASYWWRNVREPVRFAAAARCLAAEGTTLFVEIGPMPILQAYLTAALNREGRAGRALCVLSRRPARRDPMLLASLACHVAGADIREADVFSGPACRDLPRYPWQRETFWVESSADLSDPVRARTEHPMLGIRRDHEPLEWNQELGLATHPWLADHVAGGVAVVPAAAMIDMALAAARARHPEATVLEVLDLEIGRSIVVEQGVLRSARLRVLGPNGGFELASRPRLSGDAWSVSATGRLAAGEDPSPARPAPVARPVLRRVEAEELYQLARGLGLDYGPAFRTVTGVDILGPSAAIVRLAPPDSPQGGALVCPRMLDGAFQGLVALAAGLLEAGSGVLPWRFGRIRLLRPAGTPFHAARLTVTRVGPRSIRGDVLVLDDAGQPVAELLDCWFVRVTLGGGADQGGRMLSTMLEPSAAPGWDPAPPTLLATALGEPGPDVAGDVPAVDDSAMLADAFASAAALDALRGAKDGPVDPARRDELTSWLEVDGLMDAATDPAAINGEAMSDHDAILRTLLFEAPDAVADVAMLALAGDRLGASLRGTPAEPPPRPLLDQFLHDSPAGARGAAALLDALGRIGRDWPATRPLRVLQIDAGRGAFSRDLIATLSEKAVLRLVASTSPDDAAVLAETLGDSATVLAWQPGDPAEKLGSFDVITGLYALTALGPSRDALIALRGLLAPAGVLVVAEPEPNRVWRLVRPQVWTLPAGAWAERLTEAGFAACGTRALAPALWPASLIAARAPGTEPRPVSASGSIRVFAEPMDDLADGLATALRRAGMTVETEAVEAITAFDAAMQAVLVVPELADGEIPVWLARIASLPAAAGEADARVTLIARGQPHGDAGAAALLGACRVLRNEAPNIAVRVIRVDPDLPVAEASARVAEELMRPDGETELNWSGAGRLVPRLRRLGRPAASNGTPMRLAITRPGLLDGLQWQAAPPAAPGRGEVAIDVKAAALNFRDVMWAMGLLPDEALLDGLTGPTLGLECAGIVTAIGEGVDGISPGDRVMAFAPASLASSAVTVAHAVLPIPDGIGFAAAATMPVAFLTAAYALGHLARIEPGERVLIHGAAGGVGLAALQYARHRGAVVFATAGSDSKRALLRGLGVDAVMDSRSLRFADEVMRLTNGEGVDVVLNSLSGEAMERSLGVLRPFGRFLELGKRDFYGNTPVGLRPFRHNISYFGIDADQLPTRRPALAAKIFAEIADLLRQGAIRPLPHRVMGFPAMVDAFRLMQSSGHIGKIVLTPSSRPMVAAPPPRFNARPDRTYVVTGGLDGFGLATARWLVAQGARHVALLSRRGPATPGADTLVEDFAATGAIAEIFACDVGDAAALETVLGRIRATMPAIVGVVHAAVAMDDALLFQMDAGRFARALRPKLDGARNLDRLTRADPVELFLLHSSITTTFGNPGQANYVAANAAMEAVAEQRHRDNLPAVAVQWGPIGDAGYLTRETGVAALLERRLGSANLTSEMALNALPLLLASGRPVATYADIAWGALRVSLPLLEGPMFAALGGAGAEIAPVDLRELLTTLPPDEAQEKVTELLVKEVARILKLAPERIDSRAPLGEFGMDSLMAVELRLAVEQRFGITIPVLALSEGATLAVLANRVVRGLGDGKPDGDAELRGRIARFEEVSPADGPAARSNVSELTGP
jgi:acyl transferase domain-containing protein/NADPH:quinone reductase-like Zn-dependent oxidoreductase/acyl carrier protein/NADP-dependent 3-hydroxy acid dehydrogenase YdfG